MTRRLLLVAMAAFLCIPLAGRAADIATGFVDKVHQDSEGDHKYVVFIPHDYKGDKEFPVILFLHGSGETKGGKQMPIEVGLPPAIKSREKTFPFITIIPQAEKRPWSAESHDGKLAMAILEDVCKEFKTDKNRTYLSGLSMGGAGTWSLAAKFPDKWAAIVPICGGGDPSFAEKIKNIPCWCFYGDADKSVKVGRTMIEALKSAGGMPKYTEYPGVGHNSWDKAYGTDEVYTWLLEQKKK